MVISTKGRNMPDVCHFRSLAPRTENRDKEEEEDEDETTCDEAIHIVL